MHTHGRLQNSAGVAAPSTMETPHLQVHSARKRSVTSLRQKGRHPPSPYVPRVPPVSLVYVLIKRMWHTNLTLVNTLHACALTFTRVCIYTCALAQTSVAAVSYGERAVRSRRSWDEVHVTHAVIGSAAQVPATNAWQRWARLLIM